MVQYLLILVILVYSCKKYVIFVIFMSFIVKPANYTADHNLFLIIFYSGGTVLLAGRKNSPS
jgi:hypothetical protein